MKLFSTIGKTIKIVAYTILTLVLMLAAAFGVITVLGIQLIVHT